MKWFRVVVVSSGVVASAALAHLACSPFDSGDDGALDASAADASPDVASASDAAPVDGGADCGAPARPTLPDGSTVLFTDDFESSDAVCGPWEVGAGVATRVARGCGYTCRLCGATVISRSLPETAPGEYAGVARVRNDSPSEAKTSVVVYYADGGSDRTDTILAAGQSNEALVVRRASPVALKSVNLQYILTGTEGCIEVDDVRFSRSP